MTKLAVCGILLNSYNEVLSVSRKDDHSKIGLVGGKVDDGETLERAIVRECFEETGYSVEVVGDKTFTATDDGYEVTTFLLKQVSETVYPLSPLETGLVQFVGISKLLSSCSPYMDYNIKAFAALGVTCDDRGNG